ncbi:MAG: glycosyltransferase family 2 protein [Deltaproteobacteria bacterium]|nr:glycosyltransferase family 2 protein [Deltaproteobacteria bacterium]
MRCPPDPELSIVVPVRDERATLESLHQRLRAVLATVGRDFEIIFVDDASRDGSAEVLTALADADPHVRLVRLRARGGKAAALRAGFERTRGAVVVTLDADLQDDPAELPRFLAAIDAGADLVSGWKRVRHDGPLRVATSRTFNWLVARVFATGLHDVNCGYKAYRRAVLAALPLYGGMYRFIVVFARAQGARVAEIEIRHAPRRHGSSKYGPGRLPGAALDLLAVVGLLRHADRPGHLLMRLAAARRAAAPLPASDEYRAPRRHVRHG